MPDLETKLQPPHHARRSRPAILLLLCGATAIGFAPIFFHIVKPEVGRSAIAFWRLLLAAPILWGWTLAETRRRPPGARPARRLPGRRDLLLLLLPGVFFAGDLAFWHWSLVCTSVANATLLTNYASILVAIVGWIWLRERFGVSFLVGLVLAVAGACVLLGKSFSLSPRAIFGDAMGLVSAAFYAAYQLSVKRLRERFTAAQILSTSALSSAAVLLIAAVVNGENFLATSLLGWTMLVALAVVSHCGGQGLIAYALAHLPASLSSVALLFQPVVAAAAAWMILGETLGPVQIAGGATVLIGIVLARYGSVRAASRRDEAVSPTPTE